MLLLRRPNKGATTDVVARRLIAGKETLMFLATHLFGGLLYFLYQKQRNLHCHVAWNTPFSGALDGDVKLTKEQLRQIRAKAEGATASRLRKPPPAPTMPTLETESESEVSTAPAGEPAPPAKRQGEGCLDRNAVML